MVMGIFVSISACKTCSSLGMLHPLVYQPHEIFQYTAIEDTHYRAALVAAQLDGASIHFHGSDASAAFA